MAFVLADRVQELSSSPGGTGTINLNVGAVAGFVSFATGVGTGNQTYYCIYDQITGQWEVGTGTYTTGAPNTLSRTTVYDNSLGTTALINFTNGNTLNVFCTAPASRTIMQNANGNVGIGAVNDDTAILQIAGGTTTAAALEFNNGTLMTSPDGGSMEYDGKIGYFTPNNLERGVMPAEQFYRLNSTVAGANVNTAQSVFGVGVTLSASTVYVFEGFVLLSKSAGVTTHTVSYGFGGTATLNNIGGYVDSQFSSTSFAVPPVTAGNFARSGIISASAVNPIGTASTAAQFHTVLIKGTVSVNAGGTFIPQYTLSAAPGGAYTTQIGSYFRISPISASGANTSVGRWA